MVTLADGEGTFGRLLQRHRRAAGLSQQELAERAGLSQRGVADLERGARRHPYPATVRRLAEALGLDETARAALLAAAQPDTPASGPAQIEPARLLPLPLSSFVGRERELAEVKGLLESSRLLTLTGTGGIGKTRLALRAAAEVAGVYPDGVSLVELAPLVDPGLVAQAVADAVGVREQRGLSLRDTLLAALRHARLLLVLDNCEHLVQVCAELAEALLLSCPELRILATSREPLRASGETTWRVPSLSLPRPLGPPVDETARSEAGRLFVERAQAARAEFALSERSAVAVADVCRHLDGIPLALELAAARVRMLGVEQLAARLDDRFRLLVGGSRTAPLRQQTLRATVEWSYGLLTEPEQRLFDRLAVFAGGWTLEAAEAVCSGDGLDTSDVLDLLGQLVDRSLVVADGTDGPVRYRMLETLRQYARERLGASVAAQSTARRHAAYYLALAEQAEPELTGAEQALWLQRLEQEHDNFRAVLRWASAGGDIELGLRLAGAVWRLWWVHGHLSEGRRWLEGLLGVARSGGAALAAARAKALSGAGALANDQGDYSRAAAWFEESLAVFRELGDKRGIAWSLTLRARVAIYQGDYGLATLELEESLALARELGDRSGLAQSLITLGLLARDQGHYDRAAALFEESQALFRELGHQRGLGWSLANRARVADDRGDHHRATEQLEESLALFRDLDDRWGAAWTLTYLARVAIHQSDFRRAAELAEASLALFRDRGDRWGVASALTNLARVASEQGDQDRATLQLEESLALSGDLGDRWGMALGLEELAAVACAQEQDERAVRLFGAARALREAIRGPRPPADHVAYERRLAAARARLGEDAFAAAWAAGRAMTPEQAFAGRAGRV